MYDGKMDTWLSVGYGFCVIREQWDWGYGSEGAWGFGVSGIGIVFFF